MPSFSGAVRSSGLLRTLTACWLLGVSGGCIYLTPPTGLRLGDHGAEFAHIQQGSATEIKLLKYEAADFTTLYPEIWSPSSTIEQTAADCQSTLRVAIGVQDASGASESLIVTSLNNALDPDPVKALAVLASFTKASLTSGFGDDLTFLVEESRPLGGNPGFHFELKGTDKTTGNATHLVARCAMVSGRGYVVVISTLESRYQTFSPLYDHLLTQFAFTGGTVPLPSACASQPPAAPGSPVPSASMAPTPSPSSTPTPQ